ncbi:hypothetical protein [Cytobacillus gottheilii]|uniref:hypothetical protein n=1 Tax=Cytobacillus gottheilii TaxID=859144 RepID=UPI002493E229|nr:hypothetical protein [Cytobacillus gottheilii]
METQIFYKQLLPTELKEIISNFGHQKSFAIELRPLRETTLYKVCITFIEQMIKQPRILIENNHFKDEEYEELILTSMTYDQEKNGVSDIFNHDFIQFGLKNNIEYPIRNTRIESIDYKLTERIEVNGNTHELRVSTKNEANRIIKIFENSLEFHIDKSGDKLKFRIKEVQSIAAQLKVFSFLIDLLKSREIHFNEFTGTLPIEETKLHLEEIESSYLLFKNLEKVFLDLNVDLQTKIGGGDAVFKEIDNIIKFFIKNDYSSVKLENPEQPSFVRYTIGEIYLILFYNPLVEKKVLDAFSEEVLGLPVILGIDETKEEISVSPYLMLEKETLIKAANLNIDKIIKSFDLIEYDKSDLIFSQINNFCLSCLNVYDITQRKELLEIPLYLFSKVKEKITNDMDKNICEVNQLQTNFRLNDGLTSDQYKHLIKLKDKTQVNSDTLELRFCISVLLQGKVEADIFYEELDSEKQKYYSELPIFTLYQKMQ